MSIRHPISGLAGLALAAVIALSGCTTDRAESAQPSPDAADTASSFVACLTSKKVDAKINDAGQVLVRDSSQQAVGDRVQISGADAAEAIVVEGDETGVEWVGAENSDFFVNDPEIHDAYAACENEHPSFKQPASGLNGPETERMQAEQEEAALAFAQCARENGAPGFADPGDLFEGALTLPAGMTEDEFRAIAEVCFDAKIPMAVAVPQDAAFDPWDVLEEFLETSGS